MRLSAGTRLGPFEIHSFLGQGSMGEVYRAQDTRAKRAVAVKILRAQMSEREAIRKRFEREGRVLAGLSHPHICAFQEIGQADGIDYLVMEYLEGQNLAQVLAKGPLPLDKALLYAGQICSALDASHQLGLTHRDLKPANIILTRSGIKILDFGLAKLGDPLLTGTAHAVVDEDSTVAEAVTESGMILGTYQYMAPEQLEGKAVDPRADIFAFGAILFEMLTGKKAFEGKSKAGTIASVLTQQPAKLTSLRPEAPAALDWLLEGCLAKDAGDRWQTIRDVKRCLEQASIPMPLVAAPVVAPQSKPLWIAVCAGLALIAAWALYTRAPRGVTDTIRFQIDPPPGTAFAPFASHGVPALSPDGRRILFPTLDKARNSMLWVRSLDSLQSRVLEGTMEGKFAIWSADGKQIAFVQDNVIKRMPAAGGAIQKVVEFANANLCAWDEKGVLYFTAQGRPIFRVAASGGSPELLTPFEKGDLDHFSFSLIPGTHDFFYSVRSEAEDGNGVYVASLDNPGKRKRLTTALSSAVLAGNHLLYQIGERLVGSPYHAGTRTISQEPKPVEPQVAVYPFSGMTDLTGTGSGMFAYRAGKTTSQRELVWIDRKGNRGQSLGQGMFRYPAISPDGNSVAVELIDMNLVLGDIWLLGLNSQFRRRISFDRANETSPVYTADGKHILYSLGRDLYMRDAEGGGTPQLIHSSDNPKSPKSVSRDGRWLLYHEYHATNGGDLWLLPMQGGAVVPFHTNRANARDGRISPNGKWIAYSVDVNGKDQVFVETLAAEGMPRERVQVSTRGALSPHWRSDSRELYFVGSGYFLAVKVEDDSKLRISPPEILFPAVAFYNSGFGYVPSPDGQRFLVSAATGDQRPEPQPITVVLHHPEIVQR
ncbi:MAG: protein kinase [Bryobacteraceae bacterium]